MAMMTALSKNAFAILKDIPVDSPE